MGMLDGKTALVTGAGRGIGRGIALALAEAGAKVVVNDLGTGLDGVGQATSAADDVVREIVRNGGTAAANHGSVADFAQANAMVEQVVKTWGRIDILVNVAGILRDRMIFNMSEQEWDDVIDVHLKGHFATTKPASIIFRQQRSGRIINFSSISGLGGLPGQANYGAAKAGIAGFTRVVARDLGRYGVTCNAIAPGAMTRMTATVPQNAAQLRARAGTTPAMPRPAPRQSTVPPMREPEYVAPMTVFLACDEAWNINGKVFYVAGGRISLAHEEAAMRQIQKQGMWTVDELRDLVPSQLTYGLTNPAPPAPDLDIPGRPVAATAG
jgi:NAD(P)-dependent dehydrogenase (short-subunit alcohol dehydrogenase family)